MIIMALHRDMLWQPHQQSRVHAALFHNAVSPIGYHERKTGRNDIMLIRTYLNLIIIYIQRRAYSIYWTKITRQDCHGF